jgi:serine/threonine-protein kinase
VCGKTWPEGTDICPDDDTWLHEQTIMERGRGRGNTNDPFAPEKVKAAVEGAATFEVRTHELSAGKRVGDYEIEAKIGEGAMGAVYRAVHPAIGKHVAIKLVSPRLFDEPDAVKRFVAEARAVAAIRHPNIVDVFGFGRLEDGRTYLIMEWLEGHSLGARLQQGKLPFDDALELIRQIAKSLEAAHAKGVIHRDLKPENVFLQQVDDHAVVKLVDFGLAKVTSQDGLVAVTKTGQLLGTPLYMSPEQCRSKGVDHRTDIYALGCMAYELLCGRVPFDRDNVAELISAQLVEPPPQPRSLKPDLPPALDALLFRMVAKNPDERPTLTEVRRAMSAASGRSSQPLAAVPDETSQVTSLPVPPSGARDPLATATPVPGTYVPLPKRDPTPAPAPPTTAASPAEASTPSYRVWLIVAVAVGLLALAALGFALR